MDITQTLFKSGGCPRPCAKPSWILAFDVFCIGILSHKLLPFRKGINLLLLKFVRQELASLYF
jgi:hypothetical protein